MSKIPIYRGYVPTWHVLKNFFKRATILFLRDLNKEEGAASKSELLER
jgi:hypothetical protein